MRNNNDRTLPHLQMANIWTEENKYRAWLGGGNRLDEAWAEL